MDLESSIVERLQKLREWQIEQQERLLKQQHMQREMLTQKQDSIYKVLELSIKGLDLSEESQHINNLQNSEAETGIDVNKLMTLHNSSNEDDKCLNMSDHDMSSTNRNLNSYERLISDPKVPNALCTPVKRFMNVNYDVDKQCTNKSVSDLNNYTNLANSSPKQGRYRTEYLMDGVSPLPFEKTPINHVSIDDVPIPSPRKDFHTLLEERLKDCKEDSSEEINIRSKVQAKKPFLRKGQGLSRFKLKPSQSSTTKVRPRSASLSANIRPSTKYDKNNEIKSNDTKCSKNSKKPTVLPQHQLSLKNVPLPKRKVRSKSESSSSVVQLENYINQNNSGTELNNSDFCSKTQKEMEEVRIFELLEEKAENSSFCSTSSAVVAFLQQSTPFQVKKRVHNRIADAVNLKQQPSIIAKGSKDQSILKLKKTRANIPCIQINNSHWESTSPSHKRELQSPSLVGNKIEHSVHTLGKSLQETIEDVNVMRHPPNTTNSNEQDVSLHVRFSEYNEYKTIGLTDTSSISNESLTITTFCDNTAWSDSFTPESSDTEMSSKLEVQRSLDSINIEPPNHDRECKSVQCNVLEELNYKRNSSKNQCKDDEYICSENTHENVYQDGELELSDTISQSSDNDQSIIELHGGKLLSLQNNFHKIEKLKKCIQEYDIPKMNKYTNSYVEEVRDDAEKNENNLQETNDTTFKSELLKHRLLELEQEIDIFRKENAALSQQRQKLQDDRRILQKEYSEKEKAMDEARRQAENRLQEERKKLAREKAALESRIRDSQEKAQQSKLERQEIQNLKDELDKLKDEINLKESRWNAAQSRHKCQIRILKMENSKLKQELERLQSLKKNIRNKGKFEGLSNTKAIHNINKQLNIRNKDSQKVVVENSSSDSDQKLVQPMMEVILPKNTGQKVSGDIENENDSHNSKYNTYERLKKPQQSMTNIVKKRTLYETLLKEATLDLTDNPERPDVSENLNISKAQSNCQIQKPEERRDRTADYFENIDKDSTIKPSNHITTNVNENTSLNAQNNDYTPSTSPSQLPRECRDSKMTKTVSEESLPIACARNISSPCQNTSKIDKQGTRQVQHADGRVEYWYSNGNVKKIFPDQGLTKLIYYNGDVRETDKDGKVKYFYASTRTWHTTMPNGLEILEFPDGQVERRSDNGTVEVSFPDGSVRILQSDGTQKWALPDGTVIETFNTGEKILTLPNGQREIHTSAHKRREYPDGTVKLIYPDGTQETRYSNGRIRLKDKDGNLLMDSYQ